MGIARISLLESNEITEVQFFENKKTGANPFITTHAEIDTKDLICKEHNQPQPA
jgi:hypothetical protein